MKANPIVPALMAIGLSSPVALANPVSDASISMIGIPDRDAWLYLVGAANALSIADAMQQLEGGEEIIRQSEKGLVGPHRPEDIVMAALFNLAAEHPC